MATPKKVKVTFLKNPTGRYKLAYAERDSASFAKEQADLMVEEGFAEYAKAETKAKK